MNVEMLLGCEVLDENVLRTSVREHRVERWEVGAETFPTFSEALAAAMRLAKQDPPVFVRAGAMPVVRVE